MTTPYQIAAALAVPFPKMARDQYRLRGWRIIEPGTPIGTIFRFTTKDWRAESFLALNETASRVDVPLVVARFPGSGAFYRLADYLEEYGYAVRVIAPLHGFRESLTRHGWSGVREGTTFEDQREVWKRGKA